MICKFEEVNMGKCTDCDWPTCSGCPNNETETENPWTDPDYPEFDPADAYDAAGGFDDD